ncbi:MAG: AraC family transcriptional regulator ligand-binding domain-containing protein [Alsobacter sp.]
MTDPVTGMQRAGPFSGLATLLAEYAVSPETVAEGTGIDVRALTPDTQLPMRQALVVLERVAQLTGCPHFGLLFGARADTGILGLLYRLAKTAPTLRHALLDHINWQVGYSTSAVVYLRSVDDVFIYGIGVYDRSARASRQFYDLCAAIAANFIRDLTQNAVRPTEIWFSHSEPENLRPYHKALNVPLRFDQAQTCLILPREQLDLPLPTADPVLRAHLLAQIDARLGISSQDMSIRVRRIVRPQLLVGDPSMIGAARVLGMDPRVLRRRLAAEGTTFEALRDEVRFVVAREYLALSALTIVEISDALAFGTHAGFSRAFHRWSGRTPTQWRGES